MLQNVLRDSWPVSLNETTLVIGFDPEFAGEIEQARHMERGALRGFFQQTLGHPVHLEYTVLDEPVRWSHLTAADAEKTTSGAGNDFDSETAGLNPRAWLANETIRNVLETFHGDILEIQS